MCVGITLDSLASLVEQELAALARVISIRGNSGTQAAGIIQVYLRGYHIVAEDSSYEDLR